MSSSSRITSARNKILEKVYPMYPPSLHARVALSGSVIPGNCCPVSARTDKNGKVLIYSLRPIICYAKAVGDCSSVKKHTAVELKIDMTVKAPDKCIIITEKQELFYWKSGCNLIQTSTSGC